MPAKISIFCKSLGKALGLEEREGIKSPVAVYPLSDTFLPLDNTSITKGGGERTLTLKAGGPTDKVIFFWERTFFTWKSIFWRFGNLVCN